MSFEHGAGYFDRPLQHLVRNTSTGTYSDTSYTFGNDSQANVFFGHVEESGSVDVQVAGRIVSKTAATITLKSWYINISPLDRVQDLRFNNTYIIDSVARSDEDEWHLQGHHL